MIQLHRRMGSAQVHGYTVRTFHILTPQNQLKRAVVLTQQQVIHSGWLIRDRVVEAPRWCHAVIGKDHGQIVKVRRSFFGR